MFPSSSRVKINRVALKDVVGLKLVPRRRRVPKSPNKVTADSKQHEEKKDVFGVMSVKNIASVPDSNKPVQSFLTDHIGPENVSDTASNTTEGEPEDSCVGTQKAKRRKRYEPCKDNVSMEFKQKGPYTRDIDRNSHPGATGITCSERSLRRAVGASLCDFCRTCTYTPPQQKTLGKQGQKSSGPGPEQSTAESKIEKDNPVTKTPKIIVWINQYPKVILCDITQKCDVCSHNCGYVLPEALKTKVVRCFKWDMRDGFRFGPSCLGHKKHKSEESAVAKNSKLCPRVQSEENFCQSQSLTENQQLLREHTDAENLTNHTKYNFHKGWKSEASATCSASLLVGKSTNEGEYRASMWDRDVEEDPVPGCDPIGPEDHREKRKKLGESFKDGSLPSTPDSQSSSYSDTVKTCSRDREKTCQSCLEVTFGSCSACRSNVKGNCDQSKTYATQMSSEPLHQMNEVDTESFTCQRVRVYCRKINSSCARTYMPWPFSNTSRTLTAHAGATACPAEPVHPSARNNSDSPINQNQSGSPSSRTNDLLPSAPTDTTCQVSSQSEERREEDGEHIIVKRNGKRHGNMSSYSSDSKNQSKNMESAPCLMEAEESVASLLSDAAALYTPSQPGREPGTDAVSALSTPVNGPETNSSLSTPSPSSLGLSEWETATTTLSTMSSLFTHGGLSSLSATPSSLPPSLFLPEKVRDGELAEVLSASTSPRSHLPKHVIKAVEKPLFHCEETLMASCCSSPSSSAFFSHSFDSFQSCESSLLLPQDEQGSSKEILTDRSPPKLESYYITSPFNQNQSVAFGRNRSSSHNMTKEQCVETNSDKFMLPPLLSPVTSPQGHSCTSFLSPCCSDEEEEEEEEMTNKDTNTHEMLPGHHIPEIDNGSRQKCEEYPDCHQPEGCDNEDLEGVSSEFKSPSPHSSVGDESDDREEESEDETDYEDDVEQGNRGSQQVPLAPKLKANLTSGVVTDPCSSPSSDEGQPSSRDEGSSSSEIAGSERDTAKSEAAGDTQPSILDEFTAYEQDILLVDVIQDDPELFENLPQQSLLKLGPTRVSEAPKSRHTGVVKTLSLRTGGASVEHEQRLTPVTIDFHCDSPDITEESNSRPWRPQSSSTPSKVQNTWPATDKQTRNMGQSDANNNHVNGGLESRSQPIQTVNSPHNIPPLSTIRNGPWTTNPANMMDIRRQKSNSYCRQYFSESFSCGFKMCRFQHVPVEGDEKFCVETVTRFIKNPMCLQKAKAVFTGYYENNPPGVYFSMPVLLSLLWSLLKASMVSDVFSVLSVSLAHKIVPSHEFLLALFNFVREKGLIGSVPELMQLTFEMASAGLGLSLDCLDCVKNTPEFQQAVHPNSPVSVSGNHKLSSSTSFPECLNFAHSIVEIELCTKQEDWRRMGEVFRSFCQTSQHPNQVEQISGRIAIALLSESKDKLSLPFAAFAETVCQIDAQDTLIRSFLGRIGVSLMLRYHKTHQWAKGRRVVEVLSVSKVNYSTLKGLFGNEDGASRCCLVTVATELFLLSGSVEGALNTLRENEWFLSSSSWPCEPPDLDSRSRVLMRLAEKTSHRDTLEVLCNLPGIKEPNDLVDISRYSPLFNSHLQVCVDRQVLPVASDTVDFMLSKNLAVDHTMLHILLHKLGKQNLWLRAREVFRHSLGVGYYPGVSAPAGFMTLIVPCRLGEVELALTFEMFITVNATIILQLSETTTSCLSITLRRTQSVESEYLSAGSRLLSAACIPQPKLIVHYTAVNSSQEQVFTLDISSARRWLRHNHLWATEVWTH